MPEQLVQMAMAAIRVAKRPGLQRVAEWMHMLGFRGHFVTKSRGYSTNLGTLRATRAQWRADRDQADDDAKLQDEKFIPAFNAKNPGLKVVQEILPAQPEYFPKVAALHATGTIGDVIWASMAGFRSLAALLFPVVIASFL